MRVIILIILSLLLIGCRSVEKVQTKVLTDSIIIERTLVDTMVITAPDAGTLDALWECDSLGNVLMAEINTLQGERLKIEPKIKYIYVADEKGKIRRKAYFSVLAQVDSLSHIIKIQKEQITSLKKQATEKHTEKKVGVFHYVLAFVILIAILALIKRLIP